MLTRRAIIQLATLSRRICVGTESQVGSLRILTSQNLPKSHQRRNLPNASCRTLHTNRAYSSVSKPTATKLKHPVDDVYLEELYEKKQYDLKGALETLKRYAELDYTSPETLVYLQLKLHLKPMKKGRLQTIYKTVELPHEFDHDNKIGVFTDDANIIQQALDNGAFVAGGNSFIQQVLFGKISCDCYLCTPEYFKSTVMRHQELAKALKLMTPKKSFGVTSDIVANLITLKDDTIISNRSGEQTKCKIVVGQIKQAPSDLVANVQAAIEAVREQQNPKHPPIVEQASLTCCQETLQFELKGDLDDD